MACWSYQVARRFGRGHLSHGDVLGFRGQSTKYKQTNKKFILYTRLVAQGLVAHLGLRCMHAAFNTALRAVGFL